LNWFEIPSEDFDRARAFYGAMFGAELDVLEMNGASSGGLRMAFLPSGYDGVGGAVIHDEQMKPSSSGTVVYLNAGSDLQPMLDRAVAAGGSVVVPKTDIGNNYGFYALFADSEGNVVGLHSEG
jgi:predicted enzyme related to lactoylglutathione lyase